MEAVVRKHLQEITNPTDGKECYSGFVGSQENYSAFITDLKAVGFSFSTRTSHDRKGEKIFFSSQSGNVAVPFFGSPFSIEKSEHLQCLQGNNYFKKCEPNDLPEHTSSVKRRPVQQPSKKIGCPAFLFMKCIRVYHGSSYALEKPNTLDIKKILKKLKADVTSTNVEVDSTLRHVIVISTEAAHTHATLSANLSQTLHPKLKAELRNLAKRNVCCVETVKLRLEELVRKMVEEDKIPQPDPVNRCFYPSGKVIHFHMRKALSEINESQLDQKAYSEDVIKGCKDHVYAQILYETPIEMTIVSPRKVSVSPMDKFCHSPFDVIEDVTVPFEDSALSSAGNNVDLGQKLREGLKVMADYSYLLKDDKIMRKMIRSVNQLTAEMKSKLPKSNEGLLENSQKEVDSPSQRSQTAVKSKYMALPRHQRKKRTTPLGREIL